MWIELTNVGSEACELLVVMSEAPGALPVEGGRVEASLAGEGGHRMLEEMYVEIDGQLRKVLVIVKMRGGNHSKDIREYIVSDKGVILISPRRTDYAGLTSGLPERVGERQEGPPEPKAVK